LSHRLRHRVDADRNPVVFVESDLGVYIGDTQLPKPQEQANNLILWIGNSQKTSEDWAQATPQHLAAIVARQKLRI